MCEIIWHGFTVLTQGSLPLPRGSATAAHPSSCPLSVCIFLSIGQSAVKLDGERCDSALTQSLFVRHDWTHRTVRSHCRIEKRPAAVSLWASPLSQRGKKERRSAGSRGGVKGAANYASSLFIYFYCMCSGLWPRNPLRTCIIKDVLSIKCELRGVEEEKIMQYLCRNLRIINTSGRAVVWSGLNATICPTLTCGKVTNTITITLALKIIASFTKDFLFCVYVPLLSQISH